MKRIFTLLCLCCLFAGCATDRQYSVTGLASSSGDVVVAGGTIVKDIGEVGVTVVQYEDSSDTEAAGIYGAIETPLPDAIRENWGTYVGLGLLAETKEFGLIPEFFAGLVYDPNANMSPVVVYRKQWPNSEVDSEAIPDDDLVLFGLRFKTEKKTLNSVAIKQRELEILAKHNK